MPRSMPASAAAVTCASMAAGSSTSTRRCVEIRISAGSRPISAHRWWRTSTDGRELLRRSARVVPVLGPASHRPQRAVGPAPADADGRVGLLHRLGLTPRVVQLVVLPLEGRHGVGEQARDDLERLVEAVEPLLERGEVDAVGVALLLVPPRAETELEPTAGDDVERGGHVRQHRRVAVGVAGHQHADADPVRRLGQRRRGDPALQAGPGGVREDRIEVVEGPGRLEQLDVVGGLPDGQHVGPRRVLRGGLDREAHAPSLARPSAPVSCHAPSRESCRLPRVRPDRPAGDRGAPRPASPGRARSSSPCGPPA